MGPFRRRPDPARAGRRRIRHRCSCALPVLERGLLGDGPVLERRRWDGRRALMASIPFSQRLPCLPLGYTPPDDVDDVPITDNVSPSWKAPTSGGSTGRPKLIVSGDPALFDTGADAPLHLSADGCMVVPGPLYHNAPGS